jgi:hypothetical protein
MSRRRRIPERGDVAASAVADLLGWSLADPRTAALRGRGYPEPDGTTRAYRFEAVCVSRRFASKVLRASLRPTRIREVGYFEDGRLPDTSLNAEKTGAAMGTAARHSTVVASLAVQHGVPAETIRRALTRNRNGKATGPLGTLLDSLASENG